MLFTHFGISGPIVLSLSSLINRLPISSLSIFIDLKPALDEKTLDNSKATAFTDLNKNAWYYKYVTYLESIGYLKSYTGEFKPDQKITRAEFVELVYNMGKISGGDKIVSFKDVPADHPRYNVIMAAAKAGLVNGKSADTFDPDGDIKRSEVVKVLCIALGRNQFLRHGTDDHKSAAQCVVVCDGIVDLVVLNISP